MKEVIIHGRLQLEIKDNGTSSIIEKNKLTDSFDTIPKKVLHIGDKRYVLGIWNKLIKKPQYLEDVVLFQDWIKTI